MLLSFEHDILYDTYTAAWMTYNAIYLVSGVAEWVERWSPPANFPYPAPDC